MGISLAQYCRDHTLGKEVKSRLSAEDMQHIRALTHVGNNLNQIVKGLQRSNFAITEKDLQEIADIINHLNQVRNHGL